MLAKSPQAPHNIEAEQALLGALLMQNDAYWQVSDLITQVDFYEPLHQRIFDATARFVEKNRRATPITLKPLFDQDDQIGDLTVPQYMGHLVSVAAVPNSVPDYARTLRTLSLRRGLLQIADHLSAAAIDGESQMEPAALVDEAEAALHALVRGQQESELEQASTAGQGLLDAVERAFKSENPVGISTGLPTLDNLIGTLMPGDLIILGGSTSMGKTAAAQQVAYNAAKSGKIVGALSLEMTREQFLARYVAQLSEIPADRMEKGDINAAEMRRIIDAEASMRELPLYIADTRGASHMRVSNIRSRARRLQRVKGLDLLVIDHLHFIRFENPRATSVEGISQVTQDLKSLALELKVPVLVPTHLNRDVKQRANKRPILADLYGSSSIEKDADLVFFVHREAYWLERERPDPNDIDAWGKWTTAKARWEGKAEFILAKRRRGKGAGEVTLGFNETMTHFHDFDQKGSLL